MFLWDIITNLNRSPSDGEEESPKKPLPVLSYWVCGRFDFHFHRCFRHCFHHNNRNCLRHCFHHNNRNCFRHCFHHFYILSLITIMITVLNLFLSKWSSLESTPSLDLPQFLSNTLSYFDFFCIFAISILSIVMNPDLFLSKWAIITTITIMWNLFAQIVPVSDPPRVLHLLP